MTPEMLETRRQNATKFATGTKAFYDAFINGLIPCVVIGVHKKSFGFISGSNDEVRIRLTASRGAYKRGEEFDASAFDTPPRTMKRVRSYQARINTNYSYEPTPA